MSFYVKHPSGEMHLEKLISLAKKRLQLLLLVLNCATPEALKACLLRHASLSEAATEGTAKDRVAHFALREAARRGPRQLLAFFLEQETRLFRLRAVGVHRGLHDLRRHLRHRLVRCADGRPDVRHLHSAVCSLLDEAAHDVVRVPFHLVPSMVASRQVRIQAGDALVPVRDSHLVTDLLVCIFDFLLRDAVEHVSRNSADDQLGYISKQIAICFAEHRGGGFDVAHGQLRAKQVDEHAAEHFPSCFSQLHTRLVEKGRLQHQARVAYTLFLKEIGMPRSEALDFWFSHYSKPSSSTACSHTWQENERRFVYSIGHLYGQEGGRKNYSAHACSTIQKMGRTAPNAELVCPFKQMAEDEEEAYDAKIACKAALCQKFNLDDEAVTFLKPSQWYACSVQSKSTIRN